MPDVNNNGQAAQTILEVASIMPEINKAFPEVAGLTKIAQGEKPVQQNGGEENKFKSSFFGEEQKPVEIGNDIAKYIKENFGAEKPEDFFKNVTDWKKGSENLVASESKVTEFTKFFSEIPDEIFDIFEAYNAGKDWKSVMQGVANQKVDFSRDFHTQNTLDLLNHYFPNKFTKEDLEADEKSPALLKSLDMIKSFYENDQSTQSEKKRLTQTQIAERDNQVRGSIQSSLNELKKDFPGFSDANVKNISKMMATGEYRNLFFNTDGTFAPEAAKRLALAMYGEQEIKAATEQAKKQGASEATEHIINRGDNKPPVNGKGTEPVKQLGGTQAKFLNDIVSSRKTYSAKAV